MGSSRLFAEEHAIHLGTDSDRPRVQLGRDSTVRKEKVAATALAGAVTSAGHRRNRCVPAPAGFVRTAS
jgi:hypothetical protein